MIYLQSGIVLLPHMLKLKDYVMELEAPSKDLHPELVCSDQLTFKFRILHNCMNGQSKISQGSQPSSVQQSMDE